MYVSGSTDAVGIKTVTPASFAKLYSSNIKLQIILSFCNSTELAKVPYKTFYDVAIISLTFSVVKDQLEEYKKNHQVPT